MSGQEESVVKGAQTVIVKVGSALVTNEGKGVDMEAIGRWCDQIAELHRLDKRVVLVSSGAIVEGMKRIGWIRRPVRVYQLQAAAAVGQMGLAQAYEECFSRHGILTAQVLLTHADLADRVRYLNARATLNELLALGIVPVINENDTVITDEIKVGDNDTLGSLVANLVEADALVILTDQRGLYTADPRQDPDAEFVSRARAGDPALRRMAGGAASALSRGGMLTKVLAAERAARSGASTVVASGREPNVLSRLAAGEMIGTQFDAGGTPMRAYKQWMADHLQLKGYVTLDRGAARAIVDGHTSLLPVGVRAVEGDFARGDVIGCRDPQGREIARGIAGYSASETRLIAGRHTEEISEILGFMEQPELIDRDYLTVL